MSYSKRLYKLQVRCLVVFCISLSIAIPSAASAGIEELWGRTAICSIASSNSRFGNMSTMKTKYYFGKSKKRIFSPTSPDSYGPKKGTVYTLGTQTCGDYEYSYDYRGKTIYGNGSKCGAFKINGSTVVLTMNGSDDNGFGAISTNTQLINIKSNGTNHLMVSGRWSTTNEAGTVSGRYSGSCSLAENRDVKMRDHTKSEQVECCIEYSSKMCNGGVISLPSNECTKEFIRKQCKRLVGDGGIYCSD